MFLSSQLMSKRASTALSVMSGAKAALFSVLDRCRNIVMAGAGGSVCGCARFRWY